MNILKADAFSNDSGVVVDSFVFTDRFHTLEMNVQEWERFRNSFSDVLTAWFPWRNWHANAPAAPPSLPR